jgi:hypothetical protein
MKNIGVLFLLMTICYSAFSQDEGVAVAQARVERSKSVYIATGPALTLGKNLGDYSNGFGFEGGFLKRLNKVFSIGSSISYLSFKYDKFKTYPYYYFYDSDTDIYIVADYSQEGGDINLLSLGCDLKLNFIPVGDNTPVSIYGLAKPFISRVSRKEFSARLDLYSDNDSEITPQRISHN